MLIIQVGSIQHFILIDLYCTCIAKTTEFIERTEERSFSNETKCSSYQALLKSRPTLSTAEYSSGYLLFISHSTFCFWINWVRMYIKYVHENQGPQFERNQLHHYQRTWRVISIIAEKKPHAHHKTHLHIMTVYDTRPVGPIVEVCSSRLFFFPTTEVFTYSKVMTLSSDRLRGLTRSGKARHPSH